MVVNDICSAIAICFGRWCFGCKILVNVGVWFFNQICNCFLKDGCALACVLIDHKVCIGIWYDQLAMYVFIVGDNVHVVFVLENVLGLDYLQHVRLARRLLIMSRCHTIFYRLSIKLDMSQSISSVDRTIEL